MSYQLQVSQPEDKNVIIYAIIIAVIFFCFILPKLEKNLMKNKLK